MGATVIPNRDSSGNPIYTSAPFADALGFRARLKGMSGTATKNTSTNIDYKVAEERHINGVNLILNNHEFGDYVHFEIVDVDNILGYGAGTVLDRFGDTWYVDPDTKSQHTVLLPYRAKILANLYIRVVYNSVGITNDVDVKANLFLHKKD